MREIIVLETNPADGGYITVNTLFWFAVPAAQQVPNPGYASAFKTIGTAGPTAQETSDLQSGAMVEEWFQFRFPNTYTAAQIKAELQAAYATRQSFRATLPNKIQWYGVSWDGAAWSA